MQISRRNLLSGAVAASVGSVALSAKAADLCSLPQKWDQTWEVIVIGAGGPALRPRNSAPRRSFLKRWPSPAATPWSRVMYQLP